MSAVKVVQIPLAGRVGRSPRQQRQLAQSATPCGARGAKPATAATTSPIGDPLRGAWGEAPSIFITCQCCHQHWQILVTGAGNLPQPCVLR